jgi:murein DD-endopeptidase MepM/ murein hydrolase activator NlpD
MSPGIRRLPWVMLLVIWALTRAFGIPVAGAAVATFDCPSTVETGQAFVCLVTVEPAGAEVVLSWSGRTLHPVLRPGPGGLHAEVLLGAGLGMAGTEQEVGLTLRRGGVEERFSRRVAVLAKDFPEQRLALPPTMVEPPAEIAERIRKETELVRGTLSVITPASFWTLPLVRPVPGDVSSPFGLRRVLNGQPRSQHRGIDLRGAEGTLVRSAGPGIVALVGDHYFAGKSVYIDHGSGVYSIYLHLSEILVRQDQVVSAGEHVGRVGRTGRATGPHLHFGLAILGETVDPLPLFTFPATGRIGRQQ